jgi:D-sedoheptulose 7-phosphate isomerase
VKQQRRSGPEGPAGLYFARMEKAIGAIDKTSFDKAVALIKSAWIGGRQIIVCGNGGSALTALHYATDWNKSIYRMTGRPFRGVCLSANIGLFSAYANDLSYDDVFVEQLKPLLGKNDLVIGISGTGNSENVLRAIRFANDAGGMTLGICGYDGGHLIKTARHAICTGVHDMQLSEDIHLMFGHMTMRALCGNLAREAQVERPQTASPAAIVPAPGKRSRGRRGR